MDVEIKTEVDAATKTAKADKEIGVHELTTDVYSLPLESDIRGPVPDKFLKHSTLKRAVNL